MIHAGRRALASGSTGTGSAGTRHESRGDNELEELYQAAVNDARVVHDGPWGLATLEVVLGILESAKTGREVRMQHQVPSRYP